MYMCRSFVLALIASGTLIGSKFESHGSSVSIASAGAADNVDHSPKRGEGIPLPLPLPTPIRESRSDRSDVPDRSVRSMWYFVTYVCNLTSGESCLLYSVSESHGIPHLMVYGRP